MSSWINHCSSDSSLLKWIDTICEKQMSVENPESQCTTWPQSPPIAECCFGTRHQPGTVEAAKMNQTNSCVTHEREMQGTDTTPWEFQRLRPAWGKGLLCTLPPFLPIQELCPAAGQGSWPLSQLFCMPHCPLSKDLRLHRCSCLLFGCMATSPHHSNSTKDG